VNLPGALTVFNTCLALPCRARPCRAKPCHAVPRQTSYPQDDELPSGCDLHDAVRWRRLAVERPVGRDRDRSSPRLAGGRRLHNQDPLMKNRLIAGRKTEPDELPRITACRDEAAALKECPGLRCTSEATGSGADAREQIAAGSDRPR
jgi:hypothetical protein